MIKESENNLTFLEIDEQQHFFTTEKNENSYFNV